MDFRKFLEMVADKDLTEAKKKKESTAEKDHKAEKAGKEVTKDIEYDDKKDQKKKKSLKDWFEQVEKNIINELETPLPIIGQDGKMVSTKPGFIKLQGSTPTDKAMGDMLSDLIKQKKIQVVAPIDAAAQNQAGQNQAGQKTAGTTTGGGASSTATAMKEEIIDEKAPPGMEKWIKDRKAGFKKKYGDRWEEVLYATAWKMKDKMKSEGAEDAPPSTDDGELLEKWAGDAKVKPTGEYKGKSKEELKAMLAKLHKSGPHGKESPEAKKMRQINFALRAKGGWKKGEGAAMKEAEIPSSGPDYGAGLGAGRSDKVLEASKPDFLDLDKDGNKKETMKKAAADKKKQKVKESMNTLEAAYHEGKAHGLSKHGYSCRYNEGSEEHKRYHDGFKEGLDECYGLQPNRGLIVSEVESEADVVDNMASFGADEGALGEGDMDEGNAFTGKLASTPKGGSFELDGKKFKDTSSLEEFAFESLDKQLSDLLNEGLSVNMSQGLGDGMGGQGKDTVSVTATDDDAAKLMDFIKQVGLGGLGGAAAANEPAAVVAQVSDYGAPKFNGHDDMKSLMAKVTGDDYKDEEGHDHSHEGTCNECGMMEAECGCETKEEVMGEVQTPDQMTDEMAEDSAGADEVAMTTADEDAEAAEDKTKPAVGGATNEDTGSEAQGGPASGVEAGDEAEEAEEEMNESEKLDEWANDAGKKGTDASFERDIEFMTKVISGGLNKPKATGQTTIPVIAGQDARTGDEDVSAWKKLAGINK